MLNEVPREVLRPQKPGGLQPKGFFLPWDLPRDSIHHDTPLAFQHIIPAYGSYPLHSVETCYHTNI